MNKRSYYANWKKLPNGRFSPAWENTSEEICEWIRNQARNILDERPGSENPPVCWGWEYIPDDPGN